MQTSTELPPIIATGGFNTGRLYTSAGQRIYWTQFADGWLCFKDTDRMTEGWLPRHETTAALLAAPVLPGWLMRKYDNGDFQHWAPDEHWRDERTRAPDGFDFGASLLL